MGGGVKRIEMYDQDYALSQRCYHITNAQSLAMVCDLVDYCGEYTDGALCLLRGNERLP